MSKLVKELDKRENIKVVTDNKFITAQGLPELTLKARKLLYLVLGQATLKDTQFYTYEISPRDFAEIMGIASTHVYQEAYSITSELASAKISFVPDGKKRFKHIPLTAMCEYDDNSLLRIEINPRMAELILGLKGGFSKPDLIDFMRMKSPFSMAIWHLIQREMHSHKPDTTNVIKFDLSLEEVREVTGTQNTYKQISEVKKKIFDKALREIEKNCHVKVTYENIKKSNNIIGFRCSAVSIFHIDENRIPQKTKDKASLFELKQVAKERKLTPEEQKEYERLVAHAQQMEFA